MEIQGRRESETVRKIILEKVVVEVSDTVTIEFSSFNPFVISRLGWINIDQLIKDPNLKPVELEIAIDKVSEYLEIQVNLVLPDRMVYLPLIMKRDGKFTLVPDGLKKLSRIPVGKNRCYIHYCQNR